VQLTTEKIITGLRLIQADERVDLHCRLYTNAAADEIERLTTENESLKLTLVELKQNKGLRLAD